ncbi:MAG: deoxyribonuclease IV [Gemmatimonadetes bacterium]|nr:deoxyribonuclease IV [Gemmatimonadota bacterium]
MNDSRPVDGDELGAHVSSSGGVDKCPGRSAEIGGGVLQLFTKVPRFWREPKLKPGVPDAFRAARAEHGVTAAVSHDSYLINLASPKPDQWAKSMVSFKAELERCRLLGVEFIVTHPGNETEGDHLRGIEKNARGIAECLEDVPGETRVLLELTAGSGNSVGGSFENLRAIIDHLPAAAARRVGVCFDTCHAYSAGYDLVGDYEGVWAEFDDVLGLDLLELLHMNDSKHPFRSHRDQHEHIGKGTLGDAPFRKIMLDERLARVPKILETPKGDDAVEADRRNLARLRSFRA